MLPENEIKKIREELDNCRKPLFFFHDDADGLSSFLLLYRYKGDGKGIVVKTHPKMNSTFARNVEEYHPDKIFILDIPLVEQEFFDKVHEIGVPVIRLDHHNPEGNQHVKLFNPRSYNAKDDTCVTRICYHVVKQDIWIGMAGSIGDWQIPSYAGKFSEKYPELLSHDIDRPEEALFNSKLGELVKVFSFVLKGKTSDVVKCMKVLTRIEDPYEILEQKTPKGKFIYARYRKIADYYDNLLREAKKNLKKGRMFIFIYRGEKFSFSSELSNELLYLYPSKIILVGREKNGEIKYSLRSSKVLLPPVLGKALKGIDGYGGGHEHACGACVPAKENKKFIKQFSSALKKAL